MSGQPQFNPWRYATVGLELVGGVAVLTGLGYGLDRWRGTAPWGMIGGAILGIVGGLYKLVRDVMRAQRSFDRRRPGD